MTTILILTLCTLVLLAARASAGPDPGFGPKTLASLVRQANACRVELGLRPLPVSHRRWHGDRWDRRRIAIWRERRDAYCGIVRAARTSIRVAARVVFGPYADQALAVASCESGWRTTAVNGQYLGAWQMGTSERATYGHGPDFLSQALAAHRYFVASGRDWSPWQCKP